MSETSTRPDPTGSAAFAAFTDSWVRGFAATAAATEAALTALDQQVGDGDFGTNLLAGLRATLRRLDGTSEGPRAADSGAERGRGGAVEPEPGLLGLGAGGTGPGAGWGSGGAGKAVEAEPGSLGLGAGGADAAPQGGPGGLGKAAKPEPGSLGLGAGSHRHRAGRLGSGGTGGVREGARAAAGFTTPLPIASTGTGTAASLPAAKGSARVRTASGEAARPLEAAAAAFLDEVGGTSGPLFGLLFQELAAAVRAAEADASCAALAAGTAGGLAAIQRVGEAEVGDKTLVDALAPAAAALSADTSADPREALAAAARAAWQGVRATATATARRGRASYLGDRAAGVPDPGAVGIALLFSSAAGPVTDLGRLLG